jgi:uncharacterized coiled-coil DUF342 family protein
LDVSNNKVVDINELVNNGREDAAQLARQLEATKAEAAMLHQQARVNAEHAREVHEAVEGNRQEVREVRQVLTSTEIETSKVQQALGVESAVQIDTSARTVQYGMHTHTHTHTHTNLLCHFFCRTNRTACRGVYKT